MAHRVAPEAESELDEIWLYIAQKSGSIEIADRLIESITDRFFLLATHPNIGRRRDVDLRAGLRSFPVGEYVIIYRVESEDVLILHVLRGSRILKFYLIVDSGILCEVARRVGRAGRQCVLPFRRLGCTLSHSDTGFSEQLVFVNIFDGLAHCLIANVACRDAFCLIACISDVGLISSHEVGSMLIPEQDWVTAPNGLGISLSRPYQMPKGCKQWIKPAGRILIFHLLAEKLRFRRCISVLFSAFLAEALVENSDFFNLSEAAAIVIGEVDLQDIEQVNEIGR